MRAAQVVARGKVEIVDAPSPQLETQHAVVRPLFVTLSGRNLHTVYHAADDEYPFPVGSSGHEVVARVEEIEYREVPVFPLKPGETVLVFIPTPTALCEHFLAPVSQLQRLPADGPTQQFPVVRQLGEVIEACERLPAVATASVLVIGQGPAGLLFDMMLKRMGAAQIVGLDVLPGRIEAGLRFGATQTLDAGRDDLSDTVADLTGGQFPDVVIETAGTPEAVKLAPSLVRRNGHVLFYGMPQDRIMEFDVWSMTQKECTIEGAGARFRDDLNPFWSSFGLAINLIGRGDVDVAPLVTHRFPLERAAEAYELARTGDEGALKVAIEMPA